MAASLRDFHAALVLMAQRGKTLPVDDVHITWAINREHNHSEALCNGANEGTIPVTTRPEHHYDVFSCAFSGVLKALGLVLWVFCAVLSTPVQAAQPGQFEVKGVTVDVTADSAQAARAQALALGEKKAFRQLLQRLTLQVYADRLPEVPAAEITALVVDFAVADEKASSVRYIAKLDYHFRAAGVRELLDTYGVPYAETVSKPVLMLPVYQAAGALSLWDDPNPWRAAWDALGAAGVDGLVPMALPVGDLQDVRTIGAEQAIEGDMQRLEEIAKRYDASDVVVAHGILRMDAVGGLPELEAYMTRFGSALQEHTVVKSFSATPGESINQLLTRAAMALKGQVEDNWKQDNLIQKGSAQVLPVQVRVRGLKDWVSVQGRLNGVAIIRKAELVLLRRDQVRMNLHFIGDAEQLALSLDQADLVLWEEAGTWYLGQKTQN